MKVFICSQLKYQLNERVQNIFFPVLGFYATICVVTSNSLFAAQEPKKQDQEPLSRFTDFDQLEFDGDIDFERQTRGTYINISTSETACFAQTAGEYWFMSEGEIQTNMGSCLQDNFGSLYYHR